MQTNISAKPIDNHVFIFIVSFIKKYVNKAKLIMPKPNPINLPGHINPPKYSAENLVPIKNK